jgi:predicted regulator of Ras-like GTPase activity (Roadblock/LC7/MglB family)
MPPANTLSIPLSEVLPDLPEEIRHALNAADAGVATFQIPRAEVESGMRTGRLSFKWAQLRDWCSLPLPLDAPVAPDMEITLPLSSVVPHFMATRGTPDTRKPVEIDSRIPDIFSKAKSAAPADEVTAVVPAPLPPEPTSPPPSASPPPSTPVTPTQIIAHIRSLNGISGAFIATSDGLLVAGDTPGANENVLAAFAPTVFSQLTKYADMARLGLPDSIDIHLSGVSVHVRRAGKLFLGALTLGGSPLPLQELARISAALQPHTN